ncbi:MAG: ABC transporter permease [Phycisphaeraceae bacterium]
MAEAAASNAIQSEYGEQLLAQLAREKSALPTKTLFTLVLGGLRVRMMRSMVTMASIVLAIAFFTYAGLNTQLYHNTAAGVQTLERQAAAGDTGMQRRAADLRRLLASAGVDVQRTLEGDTSNTWLIVMALLTCAVGIANAMLMSVTERFREIGTMKCLGAPDALVVKLFLLESSFLGVIGAALGIIVGVLVALLAAVLQFGAFGVSYFPQLEALQVVAGSVVAGMILAVIGAVYPAAVAARMTPVDALRVEE